jgi:hypothetical protein
MIRLNSSNRESQSNWTAVTCGACGGNRDSESKEFRCDGDCERARKKSCVEMGHLGGVEIPTCESNTIRTVIGTINRYSQVVIVNRYSEYAQ